MIVSEVEDARLDEDPLFRCSKSRRANHRYRIQSAFGLRLNSTTVAPGSFQSQCILYTHNVSVPRKRIMVVRTTRFRLSFSQTLFESRMKKESGPFTC